MWLLKESIFSRPQSTTYMSQLLNITKLALIIATFLALASCGSSSDTENERLEEKIASDREKNERADQRSAELREQFNRNLERHPEMKEYAQTDHGRLAVGAWRIVKVRGGNDLSENQLSLVAQLNDTYANKSVEIYPGSFVFNGIDGVAELSKHGIRISGSSLYSLGQQSVNQDLTISEVDGQRMTLRTNEGIEVSDNGEVVGTVAASSGGPFAFKGLRIDLTKTN